MPNFSDEVVIRKAYIQLAKLHHPDVSKHSDGEIFKQVAKAYDTLADVDTKHYHDIKLQYYLQPNTRSAPSSHTSKSGATPRHRGPGRPMSKAEYETRKSEAESIRLRVDMLYYQKQNNALSYEYRILGWMVVSFLGWQQVYSHWFANSESYDQMIAFLGFFLFGFASFGMYSNLYKMYRFKTYSGIKKSSYLKKSTRIWLVYVLVGLLLLPGLNSVRKSYHLKHYAKTAIVDFVELDGLGKIEIKFKPLGTDHVIVKQLFVTENTVMDESHHWVMIRFSRANPRIIEVVEQSGKNYDLPDPLK